jgi:hypothetical protein
VTKKLREGQRRPVTVRVMSFFLPILAHGLLVYDAVRISQMDTNDSRESAASILRLRSEA